MMYIGGDAYYTEQDRRRKLFEAKKGGIDSSMEENDGLSAEDLAAERWDFIFRKESDFPIVNDDDVRGLDYVKEELRDSVLLLNQFSDPGEVPDVPHGVLLAGVPGSGKTFIMLWLASRTKTRVIPVFEFPRRPDTPFSEEDVHALFALVKEYIESENKPIILFYDELDAYVSGDTDARKSVAAALRQELDGIKGRTRGIFNVATSNKPHEIPDDLLRARRIEVRIDVAIADRDEKLDQLEYFVAQYPHSDEIDFDSLVFLLKESLTPAAIEQLASKAHRRAYVAKESKKRDKMEILQEDLIALLLRELRGAPKSIALSKEDMRYHARVCAARALVARAFDFPMQLLALTDRGYEGPHIIEEYEREGVPTSLERIMQFLTMELSIVALHDLLSIPPNTATTKKIESASKIAQQLVEQHGLIVDADKPNEVRQETFSFTAMAKSRESNKIPSTFNAPVAQANGAHRMTVLIDRQKSVAMEIIEQYGEEGIDKLADIIIKRGHITQAQIDDECVDRSITPSLAQSEKRIPVGFSARA